MAKNPRDPVAPATSLTAFSCPHCEALTTQYWNSAKVGYRDDEGGLPIRFPDPEAAKKIFVDTIEDAEQRDSMSHLIDMIATGQPSIGEQYQRYSLELNNVDVSECYNCKKLAIWVGDHMVWPRANEAPPPNSDLPDDIAADYVEAAEIVEASPRGAAALLRLCVQKLCKHLGEDGDNINADIKSLVSKGLDPRVQQMLDVVRVVGNNAVHPGKIDISDDRDTAHRLFVLVNMIAEVLISQPKAVAEMYAGLGEEALAAIEKRDAPDGS